jgi:hypothetical protein
MAKLCGELLPFEGRNLNTSQGAMHTKVHVDCADAHMPLALSLA